MQAITFQPVRERLTKLGALVGLPPPAAGQSMAEYAASILNAADPDNEGHEDVQFVVLALLNCRRS